MYVNEKDAPISIQEIENIKFKKVMGKMKKQILTKENKKNIKKVLKNT